MACDLDTVIKDACTNKFLQLANTDPKAARAVMLQLLCNITSGGVGSGVPSGVILMWSGSIASIPSGWQLCDGTNGTPDLRDKFVVGARQDQGGVAETDIEGSLAQTGGNVVTQTLSGGSVAAGQGGLLAWNYADPGVPNAGPTFANFLPPYFALAYIQKL